MLPFGEIIELCRGSIKGSDQQLAIILCMLIMISILPSLFYPGLSCPRSGYMFPDPDNLCFVWLCVFPGQAPIKRACPKGVRVPSWWDGGELNMCFVVNVAKHGGDEICLRCDAHDVPPVTRKLLA